MGTASALWRFSRTEPLAAHRGTALTSRFVGAIASRRASAIVSRCAKTLISHFAQTLACQFTRSFALRFAKALATQFITTRTAHIARALAALSLSVASASAQSRDSVTVEQRVLVTPEVTGADARRRAIDEALAEGVRRVAGVRVQSNALSVLDEHGGAIRGGYSSVVQLDAAARAVDYRVLDDEWVTTRHPELGSQLYYRVKMLVFVERESGAPDPSFTGELALDAPRYMARAGARANSDEMHATLRVSRSAFVTLFVITDDSVERVFPNEYVREVRAAADVDVEIPPPDWRARGVRLRASLPQGRERTHSLMLAVATLDAVPPPAATSMTVLEMQRWLVRIPAARRALAFAAYETVR